MLRVIGDILPIAAVIAANPGIVVVMVLMLLSPSGKGASTGYLAGWLLGIGVLVSLVVTLASLLAEDGGNDLPTFALLEILIGAGLIVLGWTQWQGRRREGESATLPSWMSAVDAMTAPRAFGLGLMLAAANPKNIALVVSAALMIAAADIATGAVVLSILVFTVVASASIGGPFIAYRVSPARVDQPLRDAREWLVQNNATIMATLLVVIGMVVIGNGIGLL